MTAFLDTLADIARNLMWLWQFLGVLAAMCALVTLALWLYYPYASRSIERSVAKGLNEAAAEFNDDAPLDRLLAVVQSPEPLPAVDAPEAEFEAWAMRAVGIANDRSYDRTLAEIRALPVTEEAS